MVTFKAVVLAHQKHSDDSYNVKIRVTHKRKSKYLSTNLTAYKTDLTRNLEIRKNSSLMFQCVRVIQSFSEAVSDLGYGTLDEMDVNDVCSYIDKKQRLGKDFSLDFFTFADEWLVGKAGSTRDAYVTCLNRFERFLGKRECDINDITADMVRKFITWFQKTPKQYYKKGEVKDSKIMKRGESSARDTIRRLATIHNAAKAVYNDEDEGIILVPRSPFNKVKFGMVTHNSQEALSVEDMQKLIDASLARSTQQNTLDVFILSFVLMGMNTADLFYAKMPKKGVLRYNRKKTSSRRVDGAEMRVKIPDCVKDRVARLSDGEDLIGKSVKGTNQASFSSSMSHKMSSVSKAVTGKTFSMYSARHTFATLARNECGVDKATVDECLNHITTDMKLADVYIRRDWERLWEVQKKVVDLFRWEKLDPQQ